MHLNTIRPVHLIYPLVWPSQKRRTQQLFVYDIRGISPDGPRGTWPQECSDLRGASCIDEGQGERHIGFGRIHSLQNKRPGLQRYSSTYRPRTAPLVDLITPNQYYIRLWTCQSVGTVILGREDVIFLHSLASNLNIFVFLLEDFFTACVLFR